MEKSLNFIVNYGNHTFTFQQGSKAYIFHTGVYNDMDKKYGLKGLLDYVAFVHECYLFDPNQTPLGALADYIATHWKKIRKLGCSDVLEKFYEQEI